MSFEAGQCVCDYEILGPLGRGGMGCVYHVRNVISNREEAMKVLLPDLAAEPELAVRFASEIKTLGKLDHPNIAQLYTAIQLENQLLMVMEYVEGRPLDQALRAEQLPLPERLRYFDQVLAALAYAHAQGVIHRDIKPGNIMISSGGIVKILDFGIARSQADSNLTQPGTTMGSVPYMSPEQVRGSGVDARSDIYSAGIVLYEMVAGRRPFDSESSYELLDMHLNATPKPLEEAGAAHIPAALGEIILTALAKAPEQRFQNANAFRNALKSVQTAATTMAAPPAAVKQNSTPPPSPAPPPHANRGQRALWVTAGALTIVLVLAGGAWLAPKWSRTSADRRNPAVAAPRDAAPDGTAKEAIPNPPAETETESAPSGRDSLSPGALNRKDNGPAGRKTAAGTASHGAMPHGAERVEVTGSDQLPSVSGAPPRANENAPAPPARNTAAEELDRSMVALEARASAVSDTIGRMRAQQEANGYGLRQDIAGALARMEAHLTAAERARRAGDVESARRSATAAEDELTKLENFTGR